MENEIKITKGFKYRIYPSISQAKALLHQMFVYNQAFNICLNIQRSIWEKNKNLPKKERTFLKASDIDTHVKVALNNRNLPFKSVVAQQARMNANEALNKAFSVKGRGFAKFKNSKLSKKSFNWNNQGFTIKKIDSKNAILTLWREKIKMRLHRDLPKDCHIGAMSVSCENNKFYVSFNLDYTSRISEISKENLDISKALGIDLNIADIALSNGELIKTHSQDLAKIKYSKAFKTLQKKQSRRVLKSKKAKIKLGSNFRKTQNKLNKLFSKATNQKKDKYHKITSELVDKFDLIVVEDLNIKNMSKSAKGTLQNPGRNIKQKSGLNRSILNTSFYQLISMLEYKSKHNGKLFTKVPPQYTSKTCSKCGQINPYLSLKDRQYLCECGNDLHRDINASINILNRGLSLFGLGTSHADFKEQSLSNSETLVSAS